MPFVMADPGWQNKPSPCRSGGHGCRFSFISEFHCSSHLLALSVLSGLIFKARGAVPGDQTASCLTNCHTVAIVTCKSACQGPALY